jgi:hypothetical protein
MADEHARVQSILYLVRVNQPSHYDEPFILPSSRNQLKIILENQLLNIKGPNFKSELMEFGIQSIFHVESTSSTPDFIVVQAKMDKEQT